jgi:hypothetical protein
MDIETVPEVLDINSVSSYLIIQEYLIDCYPSCQVGKVCHSVIFKVFTADCKECRLLGYKTPVHISLIKMDLLEIGVSVVDWIGLAQDRYRWRAIVNSVMNLRVP